MATARLDPLPATHKMQRGLPNENVSLKRFDVGPLTSYEVTVWPFDVERWAELHEDDSPWYRGTSPWGGPVAPPTIFYYPSQSMLGREIKGEPGESSENTGARMGGGFARYSAEFLAPIPVGRTYEVRGAVTDKFVRRGFGYLVWDLEAVLDGQVVQRHVKSWTFGVSPEEADKLPERPSDPRQEPEPAIAQLAPISLEIGPPRTRAFEGAGEHNGHTEIENSPRGGNVPGLLAQGALSFGLLYRIVRDRYGAGFMVGGTMDIRFIRPVFTTETLTGKGEVVSEKDGVATCRVWAENSKGETVTAGTATAKLG